MTQAELSRIFHLVPCEDIQFIDMPKQKIECESCGNPNVFSGIKCKYCKRIHRGAGRQLQYTEQLDDIMDEQQMVQIAKIKFPYIPIGGRFISDNKEPEGAFRKIMGD